MPEVHYNHASELATVTNVFSVDGTATDPTTISLIVVDPDGTSTTYTYGAAEITRTATGAYRKDISCASTRAGVWSATWVGTGTASDVETVTWSTVSYADARTRYVTLGRLKAALSISDEGRDDLLVAALSAAARGIDRHCGRMFYAEASASARVYRPAGRIVRDLDGERFLVDDISTTTDLVVEVGTSSGWSAVTAYEAGPNNAIARAHPIEWLLTTAPPWCGSAEMRLRVTARWGWPSVPEEIAQATLIQAARLYRRKDSPEGVTGSAEWGVVRLSRIDPDVAALARPYVVPGFG